MVIIVFKALKTLAALDVSPQEIVAKNTAGRLSLRRKQGRRAEHRSLLRIDQRVARQAGTNGAAIY